jgi:hypothetical protein
VGGFSQGPQAQPSLCFEGINRSTTHFSRHLPRRLKRCMRLLAKRVSEQLLSRIQ